MSTLRSPIPFARLAPTVFFPALVVTTTIAHAQDPQRQSAFSWSGTITPDRQLFLRNINGGITVERSTSGRTEVTAEKQWRRGNPANVRIVQKPSGENVVICALWNEESICEEEGIRTPRNSRNKGTDDVAVHFTVRVPEGVRLDLSTVNGSIEVNGATREVVATTVNGSLHARSTGGPVRARTVNGSIDVAMGSLGNTEELDYKAVNGSITIELPSSLGAQLDFATVNGRVATDFPVTVSGTIPSRRLRGTVGDGRIRLRASTVNGAITLRRQN